MTFYRWSVKPGTLYVGIGRAVLHWMCVSSMKSGSVVTATTRSIGGLSSMKSLDSVGKSAKSCDKCQRSSEPEMPERIRPDILLGA
jgi:hypothetical protein